MDSAAEQLWSAKTRDFLEFDSIAPTNGLPLGGVGVAAGSKGDAAFYFRTSNSRRRLIIKVRIHNVR